MEQIHKSVQLYCGDCLEVLAQLEPNSIDACVTDPPYHLTSITKRYSGANAKPSGYGKDGSFRRLSAGFMGKQWDGGDIAFRPEVWGAVWRALKPGAYLLAFGGTRTYHRMACAIEDAGFDIRDCLFWIYGSGFPKSLNLKGGWEGWGTALKPACEPIVLARKPLSEKTVAANVLKWGTGALNIDGCRVKTLEDLNGGAYANSSSRSGGTSYVLKNAIDKEFKQPPGRWPANVVHDGSDEVVAAFPAEVGGGFGKRGTSPNWGPASSKGGGTGQVVGVGYAPGSAARFFYTAKADADDRLGSKHPTVKPVDLMKWLVRLVTPPNGLVLDPFAGTGTTGEAAVHENKRAALIEREAEYQDDIRRRMSLVLASPTRRKLASKKPVPKGAFF